jgi:hypothetical protein
LPSLSRTASLVMFFLSCSYTGVHPVMSTAQPRSELEGAAVRVLGLPHGRFLGNQGPRGFVEH